MYLQNKIKMKNSAIEHHEFFETFPISLAVAYSNSDIELEKL